jgi:hypothetical protein
MNQQSIVATEILFDTPHSVSSPDSRSIKHNTIKQVKKEPTKSQKVITKNRKEKKNAAQRKKSTTSSSPQMVKDKPKKINESPLKKEQKKNTPLQKETVDKLKEDIPPLVSSKGDVSQGPLKITDQQPIVAEIKKAIESVWQLPKNVSRASECVALITVSNLGKVLEIKIIKNSGVPAFDLAVTASIKKTIFPTTCWGRIIEITIG